jgi:hypothetical protein
VHFSFTKADRTAGAENIGEGTTNFPPAMSVVKRPRTRPKQWNNGGGQHRISEGVRAKRRPILRALLRRLLELDVSNQNTQ